MEKEYINIGNLNTKILNKLKINYVTNEVIFTFERIKHVENRRTQLFKNVKEVLPIAIYDPDYIYKDWNNRDNTIVLIKALDNKSKIVIILKMALRSDMEHTKNSIMTLIKIGEKTFRKIKNNKKENLLFQKLDKNE